MAEEQKNNDIDIEESLEFLEFLKKVPQKTIDFILNGQTAEKIADIAIKNGVSDDVKIEGIAYRTVLVLSGDLPSGNLALTFELGLKIPNEISRKIANEINQFIAGKSPQPMLISEETTPPQQKTETQKISAEEELKKPSSKDVYREKIE